MSRKPARTNDGGWVEFEGGYRVKGAVNGLELHISAVPFLRYKTLH